MDIHSVRLSDILIGGLENGSGGDGLTHRKSLSCISVVESVVGSYTVRIDGSAPCETGERGFFIAPSRKEQIITHHTDPARHRMEMRWIFFQATVNDVYPLDMLYDFPILCGQPQKEELHRLFDAVFASRDPIGQYAGVMAVIRLLIMIGQPRPLVRTDMFTVQQYIHTAYAEPLTAQRLAALVHISPATLYQRFREAFGVPPVTYLNRYRLGLACQYLEHSDDSVADIARSVGYEDPLYFSRIFRREYGDPPTVYRTRLKRAAADFPE